MKTQLILFIVLNSFASSWAQVTVTTVGQLPVSVSNNAVCEGFINKEPYLFSFGGIDSTKKYNGIHLKSYRFNLKTGKSERIADLPDTLGKIAAGASLIDNVIYIVGGYHVFENRSERSSNKVHRYDVANNQYLNDAADLPTATDDHVQAVWRNKLLYIITGWSDVSNIALVQVYDPSNNTWSAATPVPNSNDFKSFGASGSIVGDTIYYFGGASSASGFRIQKTLRKGVINPENPLEIEWSISTPNEDIKGYRMAATTVNQRLHWLGGSAKTYNYNGIAYNGSGGVPPTHRDLSIAGDYDKWSEHFVDELPMDLRGIAQINDTLKYVAGGMLDNQEVTNKVYQLTWPNTSSGKLKQLSSRLLAYPNPVSEVLFLQTQGGIFLNEIAVYNAQGVLIEQLNPSQAHVNTVHWAPGVYLIRAQDNAGMYQLRVLKR